MTWEAIEYRLTGSDPLICVQWDGCKGMWAVIRCTLNYSGTQWFGTLEAAKAFAESIATPEPR